MNYGDSERAAAGRLIDLALEEDLAGGADETSRALIAAEQTGSVRIVSRAAGVLAGLPVVQQVFAAVDPDAAVAPRAADGDRLDRGTIVAEVSGRVRSLLLGERTSLNFLTHLCGIATLTRRFVDAVSGTQAEVFDTRKTLPGWRALEKYAVRAGGGRNHRLGLYDMLLIKDNHLAAWQATAGRPGVAAAVCAARQRAPAGLVIEVEVDSLEQLADALTGHPDIVLLDNMTIPQLRQAVALRDAQAPGIPLEASGGVSLSTVAEIARTGVERISVGALTHSPAALDLGFDWN